MLQIKKSFALFLLTAFLIIALLACTAHDDKCLSSLGKYKSREFYTGGAFRDYTDYAKYQYHYDTVDFTDNEYFLKSGSLTLMFVF